MSDILFAYDTFRVRDYDKLQYVVEERKVAETGKKAGQETWRNRGYCCSGDSAYELLLRCVSQKYQEEAKVRAKVHLSAVNAEVILNDLPKKDGK